MKNNSKFHLFSMANIIIIVLSFLLFAPKYTLIHFINITFYIFSIFLIVFLFLYIKIFCLIVFLFLHIKKGGLFDGLSFGMNRFRSMMSKNVDDIDSWKHKKKPSQKVNITFYSILGLQVLLQFILIILLLFIYYLD